VSACVQTQTSRTPFINVTPLIDVLLVVLIIFMVVTPLKPSRFVAKLPAPPEDRAWPPNPKTLVVTIAADHTLKLNSLGDLGTVEDMGKLSAKLAQVFQERRKNHVYRDEMRDRIDVPEDYRIELTVFIKAPRSISYGDVAKVIDGVKGAGADPIGLQLDSELKKQACAPQVRINIVTECHSHRGEECPDWGRNAALNFPSVSRL
jgi:biopolymer transport protein TolR